MDPMTKLQTEVACSVCGRKAGMQDAHRNRYGEPDLNPETPIGAITPCEFCSTWTCPDCQQERDCCWKGGDLMTD